MDSLNQNAEKGVAELSHASAELSFHSAEISFHSAELALHSSELGVHSAELTNALGTESAFAERARPAAERAK